MKIQLLIIGLLVTHFALSQDLESIKEKLNEIERQNLELRNQVMPTVQKYGFGSPQMDSLDRQIQQFDSMALTVVMSIIDKHGWLGKSQIGEIGNRTLYMTIQHSPDNKIRKKYFPLLVESAKNGESDLSAMATMKDRILVQDGEFQVYGTQSRMVEGNLKPFPVEDRENLNERRKAVGLPELN